MLMIRSRPGGFNYSSYDYEPMLEDLDIFLEEGVEGIVFRFLNGDKTIDIPKTRTFVEKIRKRDRQVVFHRPLIRRKIPLWLWKA